MNFNNASRKIMIKSEPVESNEEDHVEKADSGGNWLFCKIKQEPIGDLATETEVCCNDNLSFSENSQKNLKTEFCENWNMNDTPENIEVKIEPADVMGEDEVALEKEWLPYDAKLNSESTEKTEDNDLHHVGGTPEKIEVKIEPSDVSVEDKITSEKEWLCYEIKLNGGPPEKIEDNDLHHAGINIQYLKSVYIENAGRLHKITQKSNAKSPTGLTNEEERLSNEVKQEPTECTEISAKMCNTNVGSQNGESNFRRSIVGDSDLLGESNKAEITSTATTSNESVLTNHDYKRSYKCEECSKEFRCKSSLASHMTVHSDIKSFKCAICLTKFKHHHNYKRHVRIYHSGVTFSECSIKSDHKHPKKKISRVQKMQIVHSDITSFHKCKTCSKEFISDLFLAEHELTHSATKLIITCEICLLTFEQPCDLTKHMKIYHFGINSNHETIKEPTSAVERKIKKINKKSFKCNICLKECVRESSFVRHMKTHSNLKPYTCEICFEDYKSIGELYSHMSSHSSFTSQ